MKVVVSLHDGTDDVLEAHFHNYHDIKWIEVEMGDFRLVMFDRKIVERLESLLGPCLQEWDYATGKANPSEPEYPEEHVEAGRLRNGESIMHEL